MMTTLTPKDPDESFTVLFDFFELLGSIDSAGCAIETISGLDPVAASMLIGAPQISGTKVAQRVAGGAENVDYRISCTASSGADVYVLVGVLPVREAA